MHRAATSSAARAATAIPAIPPIEPRGILHELPLILLAVPVLTVSALLPSGADWLVALTALILFGVPHGALDGEIARGVLQPRFNRTWFAIFSLPYLSLSALVLVAWHLAPGIILAAFLAASVWHFGSEDAGESDPSESRCLVMLVTGGLPIALPLLLQPTATNSVLATIAATPIPDIAEWLSIASTIWLGFAIIWTVIELSRGKGHTLLIPAAFLGFFATLPPLTAFTIYFVCIHAQAHTCALIRNPVRAPRVHDVRSATRLAVPITILTILIGLLLWPIYSGPPSARLLTLTLQGLAALTLPHMLLDLWMTRYERKALVPTYRSCIEAS